MPDQDGLIHLNGVNGAAPGYLVQPFALDALRARAASLGKGERIGSPGHINALRAKQDLAGASFAVPADATPEDLSSTGWAMIFPATADAGRVTAILEALSDLVELRRSQAGDRFFVFRGADGFRPGDSADAFVTRRGGQPGTPDVDKVPYYLLIVADPVSVPYSFQYELDVQYGVGRIHFETLDEYAQYARSVRTCETPGKVNLARRAVFFGVANGLKSNGDLVSAGTDPDVDRATSLSAQRLVMPLHDYAVEKQAKLGWDTPTLVEPLDATKANLARYLGGDETPALLFTASHGLGWPYGHPSQYPFQGALVTQDWPGPTAKGIPTRDMYFGAEDVDDAAGLLGTVAVFFACFGGGTPYWDDAAVAQDKQRQALAHRAFLAALPRRLLSHPRGGALAVIAHVERAWGYSFDWSGSAAEPASFQNMLFTIMRGLPVGFATEHLNLRYAQFATMLAGDFEELKFDPAFDSVKVGTDWLATNDARGYAVIGDPAVRLSVAAAGSSGGRTAIERPDHRPGVVPVVLSPDGIPAAEQEIVSKEIADQADAADGGTPLPEGQTGVPGDGPAAAAGAAPGATPATQPPPVQPPVQAPVSPTTDTATPHVPFASPIDGLAFAVGTYSSAGPVGFAAGPDGSVSFNILDDAKNAIKDVVLNLNAALQNLSAHLLEATERALTLEVTTSVVDDLDTFDAQAPAQPAEARFKTTISATGDIEAFLPRRAGPGDALLLQVHKDMVAQGMVNRTETVKAIGELVARLFSPTQ